MQNFTSRKDLIRAVDTVHTRRSLREHGMCWSVQEICELVDAGDSTERRQMASRLLAVSYDEAIETLLVAAYSGYVGGGKVAKTHSDLTEEELWSLGLDALVRAIRSAARCGASDFHIIKSMSRDFNRAMVRHRRTAHEDSSVQRLLSQYRVETSSSFEQELTVVSVNELVEWVATQFNAEPSIARMVVATRLGGFSLSHGQTTKAQTVRQCRARKRVEEKIRNFTSPAEGLAANVLRRAS